MNETQPLLTDALARLRHLYSNLVNGGVRDAASAKRIAEGLLSPVIAELERGTPAPAGVEPVAYCQLDDANAAEAFSWPGTDKRPHHITPLYTAEGLAMGRVPLSDEQIDALDLPPSGAATVRDLVRILEAAHGIKGKTK